MTDEKWKPVQWKLKHLGIPESEYSFNGEKEYDYLYVEEREDTWEVISCDNVEKTVRGTFYKEWDAYDFMFYLVMKKHVDIRKRWWRFSVSKNMPQQGG